MASGFDKVGLHRFSLLMFLNNVCRDVDIKDDTGWTPLIIASSAGDMDIVQMLIEKGAKVSEVPY